MNQRQPRIEEPAYLAFVRKLPCLICQRPGSDPAHLRTAARQYGKRQTGMGEKPDDKWVLPLCRHHHDEQHSRNELAWWTSYGIPDPFAVAMALYASWPGANREKRERRKIFKARVRKPKAEHRPINSRTEIQSRGFEPGHRPLRSRNNLRKELP
jgi:hypothetical protein